MVARFTLCDSSKLELALTGDLPATALGELSHHLQSCPHCRGELETLAGGERWASDARQFLSSSDELVAVQEMTPPTGSPPLPHDFSAPHFFSANSADEDSAIDLDFLSPSDDPGKLGRLGSYEIESVIGRGGFGIVLKALDPNLNRYVAIKALSGTLVRSSAARKRFHHEAQAAAAVVHDHVIPIHHIETSGPAPFLVMPFVPGRSLQERIDERGPLEAREVLRIAMQTAKGLAAAHAQGLVHRDIKPANILLENGVERVRITDFGLARAVDDASQTQSGYIAGTPQYMAPEQARGEALDARADLFSLGSVIYAMCTGRPPFRAETTLAVLRRICDDEPRPLLEINPEVPSWLAAIVDKLLAKKAADRFQSADEVAELLGQWLAHVQQPLQIPPPVVVVPKPNRPEPLSVARYPWLLATGITAAVVVIAALGAWQAGLLELPPSSADSASAGQPLSPGPIENLPVPDNQRTEMPLAEPAGPVPTTPPSVDPFEVELSHAWHDTLLLEAPLANPSATRSIGEEIGELNMRVNTLEQDLLPGRESVGPDIESPPSVSSP
jgi:serine/threonine-protein kinase